MTNAPETRKTHIVRLAGTNRDGDVLQDFTIDIERMDSAKNVCSDDNYQGLVRRFKWADDPNSDDYNPEGNPARTEVEVKVCDVESEDNPDDPDEWVPVKVIKKMKMTTSVNNYQGQVERLLNDELNETRVFEVRRIIHHDTNIDDDAQAAFDADPTLTAFVVPGDQYVKLTDEESTDKDQYVEHEIITYLKHRGNTRYVPLGKAEINEGRQTKLLNQYQIDESEEPTNEVIGVSGINPPYRLDPFQNIVNVSWGGLAVEYNPVPTDHDPTVPDRSFIKETKEDADLRKAVMSFWFRVPTKTMTTAASRYAGNSSDDYFVLNGVIPFIVFGPQYVATIFEYAFPNLHVPPPEGFGGSGLNFGLGYITGRHAATTPPSYIGVNCHTPGVMTLEVNLQTPNHPVCTATHFDTTTVEVEFNQPAPEPGTVSGYDLLTYISADISFADEGGFESFGNSRYSTDELGVAGQPVVGGGVIGVADQWHHCVLSWDITPGCKTKGTGTDSPGGTGAYTLTSSKMWCAIDDVNMDKANLPANWTFWDTASGNPNDILSNVCGLIAGQPELTAPHFVNGRTNVITDYDFGNPQAVLNVSKLPLAPCFIPSPIALIGGESDLNYDIEMAEVQIWSDVTLDTSVPANRLLLINADGKPELDYTAVDQVLGTPVVRLHGTGGLKRGNNKGTLDDFTPVGPIKKYKPDPSLYGPQFPK